MGDRVNLTILLPKNQKKGQELSMSLHNPDHRVKHFELKELKFLFLNGSARAYGTSACFFSLFYISAGYCCCLTVRQIPDQSSG